MTTTPTRGRSKRPTRAEVNAAWQHVREAAAAGNLQACEIVIRLADPHQGDEITRADIQRLGIEDNENGDKAQVLAAFIEAAPVLRELLDDK